MGWGTSYINPEGYLNRITIEQIDDEIETELDSDVFTPCGVNTSSFALAA